MHAKKTLCVAAALTMMASVSSAKDPETAANNSYISLSGTIVTVSESTFELDYGDGIITVEMDDWDFFSETYPFLSGDKVVVYGRVDDDLYETTTIEAGSVYLKDLNTYYYANDADEEDAYVVSAVGDYAGSSLQVSGLVKRVDGRDFTIDTGSREIKVDTDEMPYNPMDDKGYQKITVGDYVQVSGDLDIDFFEKTEIKADFVTTLIRDKTKRLGNF